MATRIVGSGRLRHVLMGWRFGRQPTWASQRTSGVLLCGLAAAVALTGYLLYYFAPDTIRPGLGWIHAGVGTAMAFVVVSHRRRD